MKSLFCLLITMVLLVIPTAVVQADWEEYFDTYTEGPLPPQSDWESWDDAPGALDFNVTGEQFLSEPFSVEINGGDDAVHQYSDHNNGKYYYTAWQFIPSDATGDATYFILMNTYVSGTHNDPDWSVQVAFDPVADTVTDEHSLGSVPLAKDRWMQIKVDIDLINDTRTVYYGEESLGTIAWTSAAAPGGALNIAAVDLWANNTTYNVYYDNMSLLVYEPGPTFTPAPPTDTPTPEPTDTPTPAITDTPTPEPTETPTVVPPTDTPTQCTTTGVTIYMPSDYYSPGDPCYCDAIVCNAEGMPLTDNPLFVILDVFGSYFFAPTFSEFDYYSQTFDENETVVPVLPQFDWPEGAGSASGITWYGAMTDAAITQLFGELGMFTFGWGS
jgi:hypothetical protein